MTNIAARAAEGMQNHLFINSATTPSLAELERRFQAAIAEATAERDKEIERLRGVVSRLRKALWICDGRCESLHHSKEDQHGIGEPCPVEQKIIDCIDAATTHELDKTR